MATMTGATAAEEAIETTATAQTPARTVPTGRRNRTVRLSDVFQDGQALLEAAKAQRLEGVVAKRADSPYMFWTNEANSSKSDSW